MFSSWPCGPDAYAVGLVGELDLATAAQLCELLTGLAQSGPAATILVDLSDVCYIDCRSVGVIVAATAAAREHGRYLRVVGLRGLPRRVFQVLRLESALCDPPTRHAAGQACSRPSGGTGC